MEESSLEVDDLSNILYLQKKYDILISALKLLQSLALLYTYHRDSLYFPERLKRFLSLFEPFDPLKMGDFSEIQNISGQMIEISNQRTVTLPAALTYLVTSSTENLSFSNSKQH